MNTLKIVEQVLALFFMMIIGYIARKAKIISGDMNRGLSEILLKVTLPCLIISSFNVSYSKDTASNAFTLLLYSLIIHICLFFVSNIFYNRYPKSVQSVLRYGTIFSNCGYMGIPVIESIYGKTGIFYTSIFNIPFNILIWILGVYLFLGKSDLKTLRKAIINPGLISTILGVIMFIFSLKLPNILMKTFEGVGSITTPLSMILIGSMIAEIPLKELFLSKSIYYFSFIRLILIPVSILYILNFFKADGMLLSIPVLITAMPAAANTPVFAEIYGGDTVIASKCVLISTLISIITIPLIIFLIQ
ncbi:AEC family transporter [Caloramator sp. E03]|uniref:AEC family transporter n=1 Tax=Caloramator sp. E03 TaxID=2576307 RepID=UPI0011101B2E|nr:AEC family transporter [Caloramator sp. E03]QCX34604.1 AEC family transporter [Caloramator sp. E03]